VSDTIRTAKYCHPLKPFKLNFLGDFMNLRSQVQARMPLASAVLFALATLMMLMLFASHVQAAGHKASGGFSTSKGKAGFSGPQTVATVAQALKMNDDAMVTLKGTITKQTGHEEYEFKDSTGTIAIEIDDDDWWGLTVSPTDVVIIYGEVDTNMNPFKNAVEIDVERITKQ